MTGSQLPKDLAQPPEGYPSEVQFTYRGEIVTAGYAVTHDGRVVVEGDMVLGALDDLFPAVRDPLAANRTLTLSAFPSPLIQYSYDNDVTETQRHAAARAMNIMSRYAPVRFTRIADNSANFGGIRWRKGNEDNFWCRSEVGYGGPSNATRIDINGCGSTAEAESDPSPALVHELTHALGFIHEHQRSDASSHVDYDSSCVDMPDLRSKASQFGADGFAMGPYEIDSIMHYGSHYFSKRDAPDFEPDGVTTNAQGDLVLDITSQFEVGTPAPVMQTAMDSDGGAHNWFSNSFRYKAVYDDGLHSGTFEGPDGDTDDGTEFEFYPEQDGSAEFALLLDVSTFHDTDIGVPGATVQDRNDPEHWTIVDDDDQAEPDCPSLVRKGKDFSDADAMIPTNPFLATRGMLSAIWNVYGPMVQRQGNPQLGDRLGSGMTWGDFDGDGLLDLAVSDTPRGEVVVYRGVYSSTAGALSQLPVEILEIDHAGPLAAGDFNDDGFDELVVGTPGAPSAPSMGAPVANAGGVVILLGSDSGLEHGREPVAVTSELTDRHRDTDSVQLPIANELPPTIWRLHPDQSATVDGVIEALLPIHRHTEGDNPSTYVVSSGVDWNDGVLLEFPSSATCQRTSTIDDLFVHGGEVGAALHVADIDADGIDDLLIGAPQGKSYLDGDASPGATLTPFAYRDTGIVLVYRGTGAKTSPTDEVVEPIDVLTPYTRHDYSTDETLYLGSHQGAEFGFSITSGDVTGNGCVDIIVGAPDDYGLLPGTNETDGDHRMGAFPYTNTPGRAWVFESDHAGNFCATPVPSGESTVTNNAQCPVRFRAALGYSEPTGEEDADFGYAVEHAGDVNVILVGAPGTDIPGDPYLTNAGAVWGVRPYFIPSTWQRIDQQTPTSGSTRFVAGAPAGSLEYFGSSLAYSESSGLLVGTPGDLVGQGSIDWYERVGPGGWLFEPSPAEPPTALTPPTSVSGFRAEEVLADPTDAAFGTHVAWVPWEEQSSPLPGFVGTAPLAIQADPSLNTGAVIGLRQTTIGGTPFSTAANDLLMVTR